MKSCTRRCDANLADGPRAFQDVDFDVFAGLHAKDFPERRRQHEAVDRQRHGLEPPVEHAIELRLRRQSGNHRSPRSMSKADVHRYVARGFERQARRAAAGAHASQTPMRARQM